MYPVLFKIGPIPLRSYGLMMAIAFLVGRALIRRELRRKGLEVGLADAILLAAVIGGVVGAKIYFLIEHWGDLLDDPFGMFFSGAGLVWYGGLLGGAIAVLAVLRLRQAPLAAVVDTIAPALALGYVFGRIGCLLNGDDYGKVTTVPWAMSFPKGSPPTTELVHPTQIYEMLISLGIFFLLWSIRKRVRRDGFLIWTYFALAGVERFAVEFWRITPVIALGLTMAQMLSIGLILVGSIGMRALWREL